MIYQEKTIKSETVYEGKVIRVRKDIVSLPDNKTSSRDIVEHSGGVGVVAFNDKDEIILVEQYRKPYEKSILEIPAGKINPGEDPLECGKRELEEETGYKSDNMIYLGELYPSPGYTNEIIHLYYADKLLKGEMNPDEDEYLDVKFVNKNEFLNMILKNEVSDAKTVCGFLKAQYLRGK